jgi:ABC-2 type transport system permease protein
MSSATRTSFYRELGASLFSPARYATFAAFFTLSAAFLSAALQLGEGTLCTLEELWTISVALPLPIFISLVTMPLFAGERAAGTYESLALLPIPIRKIVIGKFAATFLTVCVALAGTIVPWLLLMHALRERAPSSALLCVPMILLVLHAFSWTALGTLSSALARRPWIAATGTLLSGGALMLLWAAFSRFFLDGNWRASPFPIWGELLDAAGGRIAPHSVVFHVMFGLWCLFVCIQTLEARR